LSFDGTKWSLKGKAPTPEGRVAALAAVDALSAGKNWLTEIAAPTAIEICRYKLSAFSAENAILFDPASSHLTEGSVAALASAAGALAACPDAYIYVEGHTDSDGDENRNLALSVARSEAVIAALVAASARTDRLYAVGYGESAPVADNETPAGKQANRRIVFTILDKPL
jgi:outer membrane protein OmpA-like peptidoglycan-associated protein